MANWRLLGSREMNVNILSYPVISTSSVFRIRSHVHSEKIDRNKIRKTELCT